MMEWDKIWAVNKKVIKLKIIKTNINKVYVSWIIFVLSALSILLY